MSYLKVKKTGVNKGKIIHSNFEYNPSNHRAISYDWWCFCTEYKGYILYNDYSYSSSTGRHQGYLWNYLSKQNLRPDLTLYLHDGFSSDIESDLKGVVRRYLKEIKYCRNEIKAASRAITRTKKRLEIKYYRDKIRKIISIIKGDYKSDNPVKNSSSSRYRYSHNRLKQYTNLTSFYAGNLEHLENDLDLKVTTWNESDFTILINKSDVTKILTDDKIFKKSKSEKLSKLRLTYLNLNSYKILSEGIKTYDHKYVLSNEIFDKIKDLKNVDYKNLSSYDFNLNKLAIYQLKNGITKNDFAYRYSLFSSINTDLDIKYKSYKDLAKIYNLSGHKLEIKTCLENDYDQTYTESNFIKNLEILIKIRDLFFSKNNKLNHDAYYKFLNVFSLENKTSWNENFLKSENDIEKIKNTVKILGLDLCLELLKTCASLSHFQDTINYLYYNFSILDTKLDKLIYRQIEKNRKLDYFCERLHDYFVNREKRLKETEPRLLKPVLTAQKLELGPIHDYNEYKIFIPQTLTDIRKLGRSQNHCIGSKAQGYINKLENGYNDSLVIYISKSENDLKHGYTFYLENNRICQANGFNNCRPDLETTEIVKNFVNEKLAA